MLTVYHSLDEQALSDANQIFRQLIVLYIQVTIFQHICEGYHSRSRGPSGLFAILTSSDGPSIIAQLGIVHRVCIWENITLKAGLNGKGMAATTDSDTSAPSVVNDPNVASAVDNDVNNLLSLLTRQHSSAKKDSAAPNSPQEKTAVSFRYLLTEIPKTLAVFFRGWSTAQKFLTVLLTFL